MAAMRRAGRPRPQDWDFPVDVGRVGLRNPVIASSGTYGYGLELASYGDPSLLGAVIVKSLSVDPRPGFAPPRVRPLPQPGSMLNAIGVPNPGVTKWGDTILPGLRAAGVAVVASVWGTEADAVVAAAELMVEFEGPIAWEVNLSCPNKDHPGSPVAHDPVKAAEVCAAVRAMAPASVGIWAKLAPDAPDVIEVALACQEAGADAVNLTNTYPAGDDSPYPRLGGGTGGMSGAILRRTVRPIVEQLGASHPDLPVIACGGVLSSGIALDYLHLGAAAVAVGTASLYDPRACHTIARNLVRRLKAEAA